MNSDMVKPEHFGHLHLVYHFTVPLAQEKLQILFQLYMSYTMGQQFQSFR